MAQSRGIVELEDFEVRGGFRTDAVEDEAGRIPRETRFGEAGFEGEVAPGLADSLAGEDGAERESR